MTQPGRKKEHRVFALLQLFGSGNPDHAAIFGLPTARDLSRANARRPLEGREAKHLFPAKVWFQIGHKPEQVLGQDLRWDGTVLTDFMTSVSGFLIVHERVALVMETNNAGPTEFINVEIRNDEEKTLANDFYIVNPIGAHDVIDWKASKTQLSDDGTLTENLGPGDIALDRKKVTRAPDLFRIQECPTRYIISKRIAAALRALEPDVTNRQYSDAWDFR